MQNEDSVSRTLYHGSKTSGIKVFQPQVHFISKDKPVVFATDDKNYALAMMCGTGDELAVSYAINLETGKREMYIDELQPGKLKLLEQTGYLYEVDAAHFGPSPEGLEGEYVSFEPAEVLAEEKIENIAEILQHNSVHLIAYKQVPESMAKRGEDPDQPEEGYHPDRFK